MKNAVRSLLVFLLVTLLIANPALLAWGNPPPGRWEKVAQTKPGAKIKVYTRDGMKEKLIYQVMDDQFLICRDRDNNEIKFELAAIDKIVLSMSPVYRKNGALVGAGLAAGISAYAISQDKAKGDDYTPLMGIIAVAIVAGAGAGIGYLTGAALGAPGETIYISKDLAMREAKE